MESFFSEQSPEVNHGVVNYSSSNYGGFLFRSPNSPPPSLCPSPSPSIASLSQLFLNGRTRIVGSRAAPPPCYFSLPSFSTGGAPLSNLSIWQPPLLPLPRSATLPAPTNRIEAATAATAFRSRRQHSKRKAKSSTGARKDNLGKKKEEGKRATVAIELPSPRSTKVSMVNDRCNLAPRAVDYDDLLEDEVYSLSPPPSSLPFPKFSLTTQKVSGSRIAAGSCTAEAVTVARAVDSGADDLRCALRI